jgi:hypothetical protein
VPSSPAAKVILASGLGADTGGGLYALRPAGVVETLDQLSTSGLATAPDGARVVRFPWTDEDPDSEGEAMLYDARGALRYARIAELREPHTALWTDDDTLAVVSTLTNAILWLDADLRVVGRWAAPGTGDCWHLNSLTVVDGRLIASAFGRFGEHRGWSAPGARDGAGIVFDVETGEDILTGLTAPHDPLYTDGRWYVCNSGTQELWVLEDGRAVDRVALGGWTRGLHVDGDRLLVGVSAPPLERSDRFAEVVALDRATLQPCGRWTLPCRQVFALAEASPALLTGLTIGFATNAVRGADLDGTALLRVGDSARSDVPLAVEDCRGAFSVDATAPTLRAGGSVSVGYRLVNGGTQAFSSRGALPVLVGAFWTSPDGSRGAQFRARLPSTVAPGGVATGDIVISAPLEPGAYVLTIAPLQEHVRWFTDTDMHRTTTVQVLAA